MANHLLTHIIKDTPSSEGWKKLMFITYKNGVYYHMFTDRSIDAGWIAQEEQNGSIFKVKLKISIPQTHWVWLTDEGKLYIAPKDNPFRESILTEIENYYDNDIYSISNLQRTLDALWRNPNDQNAMEYLIKSPEWERILYILRIQLSPLQNVELPEWIYRLLASYDEKYGKVFNKYCSELQMKVTLFDPPSITIINPGNDNTYLAMKVDIERMLDYYQRTAYYRS